MEEGSLISVCTSAVQNILDLAGQGGWDIWVCKGQGKLYET